MAKVKKSSVGAAGEPKTSAAKAPAKAPAKAAAKAPAKPAVRRKATPKASEPELAASAPEASLPAPKKKISRAKTAPAVVEPEAPAAASPAVTSSLAEVPAKRVRRARTPAADATAAPSEGRAERSKDASEPPARAPSIRLHKFLAHGGAGSRREAETFIEQGRVSVNGKPITKLGFKVDPAVDRVLLDGEPVKPEAPVYFLLHKPAGFICTNHDERGRPRAVDLLRGVKQRVYTVGRLDADSLGLILVSNDGDLANIVCHPRYRIQKRYQVAVKGFVTRDQIAKLEAGVWLAEGKSSPAKVVPLGRNPRRNETILEMTIFEGRNREIRRVFANIGLNVRRLLRISLGPLELEGLQPGETRAISRKDLTFVDEAKRLYEANKEAWDAELPLPEKKVWRPRPRKPMGGSGGAGRPSIRGPRREGGFGGPRREGGYGPPRREGGGYGGGGGGGGYGGPRREGGGYGGGGGGGGYGGPRREGGYGPPRREGGGYGGGGGSGGGGYGGPPRPGGEPRRPRPHY